MSILIPKTALGRSPIQDGSFPLFIRENEMIYLSGSSIVVENFVTSNQTIISIPVNDSHPNIEKMTVDNNALMAYLLFTSKEVGWCSIEVSLIPGSRKHRILTASSTATGKEVKNLNFFKVGNFSVATFETEFNLEFLLFSWKDDTIHSMSVANDFPGCKIFPSPIKNDTFHVVGSVDIKQYTITEDGSVSLSSTVQRKTISSGGIIACLSDGDIYECSGDGSLFQLLPQFQSTLELSAKISYLEPCAVGLIAVDVHSSMVYNIQPDDSGVLKLHSKTQYHDIKSEISQILTDNEGSRAFFSCKNGHVYSLSLPEEKIDKPASISDLDLCISPVVLEHSLTDFGICKGKPYIVTCGKDGHVRIWNLHSRKLLISKYFPEEPLAVSLHPSGHVVLVGFQEKVRLYTFLVDDLKLLMEYPIKSCSKVSFSNGGQYFAAAAGNVISLVNMTSFQIFGTLRGHSGKIKSLMWSSSDFWITSSATDGTVYCWSVRNFKRENELIVKGCIFSSSCSTFNGKSTFAVGSDKTLREIIDSQISHETSFEKAYTKIELSPNGRILAAGTESGILHLFQLPLADHVVQDIRLHKTPIIGVKFVSDSSQVVTASEDGIVFVTALSVNENLVVIPDVSVLASKGELNERNTIINETRIEIDEMKISHEYQLRLRDMDFAEKFKEEKDNHHRQMESLQEVNSALIIESKASKESHEKSLSKLNNERKDEISRNENKHNSKLMTEYLKYQEQDKKLDKQETKLKESLDQKNKVLADSLEGILARLENDVLKKDEEITKIKNNIADEKKTRNQLKKEVETGSNMEYFSFEKNYNTIFQKIFDETMRFKGENGIIRKKFLIAHKDIEDAKNQIVKLISENTRIQKIIKSLENDVSNLKKDVHVRDELIQEKEKTIFDMKLGNQELEKYKFVLDHRIKELRRQIEPKEHDLANMNSHVSSLGRELEDYYLRNTGLEATIRDLEKTIEAVKFVHRNEKDTLEQSRRQIETMKFDLEDVMSQFQKDPKLLQNKFLELSSKYSIKPSVGSPDSHEIVAIHEEWFQQKRGLQNQIDSLRHESNKFDEEYGRKEGVLVRENMKLINDLVKLRKEVKNIK